MGEASRKRKLTQALADQLQAVDRDAAHKALDQVVRAITDFHGADCLLYAEIGAGLLAHLGLPARAVAGSAAWRVGPGDSDLISHAPELGGSLFHPEIHSEHSLVKAAMFHAWIEVGDLVIDFTTGTLRDKARMLDQADGGNTRVDWSPPALWINKAELLPLKAVRDHPHAGVCSYVRHERLESAVLGSIDAQSLEVAIHAAAYAYRAAVDGQKLQVIGMGDDGAQTEPAPRSLRMIG